MYFCWCFAAILFVIANGQREVVYIFGEDEKALTECIKDYLLDPIHTSLHGEDKSKLEQISTVLAKKSSGKAYTTASSVRSFFYRFFLELSGFKNNQNKAVRRKAKEAWIHCAEKVKNTPSYSCEKCVVKKNVKYVFNEDVEPLRICIEKNLLKQRRTYLTDVEESDLKVIASEVAKRLCGKRFDFAYFASIFSKFFDRLKISKKFVPSDREQQKRITRGTKIATIECADDPSKNNPSSSLATSSNIPSNKEEKNLKNGSDDLSLTDVMIEQYLECAFNSDTTSRNFQPDSSYIYELETIDKLLDYILVDWSTSLDEARNMIEYYSDGTLQKAVRY